MLLLKVFAKCSYPLFISSTNLEQSWKSFSLLLTTRIMPCSVCNGNHVVITDPERGEIICSNCGHVMVDKIQETMQEWRAFNYTDKGNSRSRMGTTSSLARHDMGLYTIIGQTNRDASGHNLTAPVLSTISRLRVWDNRTQLDPSSYSPSHRNFQTTFNNLARSKDKLGLSYAIIEKTAYIYRKAHKRGLIRGRSMQALLAACVYIACREMENPRTLRDLATIMNIKRKDITRSYRMLVLELDFKIPLIDPMKCIIRISNNLDLSEKTKRKAMRMMDNVIRSRISAGKNPMGLAASILYLSCLLNGDQKNQTAFAQAAGVTELTIRNIIRILKNHSISIHSEKNSPGYTKGIRGK
jgi:transcription initiation factor TFIIB